jgi:hypothetical protein
MCNLWPKPLLYVNGIHLGSCPRFLVPCWMSSSVNHSVTLWFKVLFDIWWYIVVLGGHMSFDVKHMGFLFRGMQ